MKIIVTWCIDSIIAFQIPSHFAIMNWFESLPVSIDCVGNCMTTISHCEMRLLICVLMCDTILQWSHLPNREKDIDYNWCCTDPLP